MASGSVAHRYATALMSLGVEDGHFEQYAGELDRVRSAFDASPDLRDLWLNPANDREQRMAAVDALAGPLTLSLWVANLLRILVERQRLASLAEIARAYRDLVDQKIGRVQAVVTSATALSPELIETISAALARMSGKSVVLETKIDARLLGGVVARVGGTVLDGSVKTQLEELRHTLQTVRMEPVSS